MALQQVLPEPVQPLDVADLGDALPVGGVGRAPHGEVVGVGVVAVPLDPDLLDQAGDGVGDPLPGRRDAHVEDVALAPRRQRVRGRASPGARGTPRCPRRPAPARTTARTPCRPGGRRPPGASGRRGRCPGARCSCRRPRPTPGPGTSRRRGGRSPPAAGPRWRPAPRGCSRRRGWRPRDRRCPGCTTWPAAGAGPPAGARRAGAGSGAGRSAPASGRPPRGGAGCGGCGSPRPGAALRCTPSIPASRCSRSRLRKADTCPLGPRRSGSRSLGGADRSRPIRASHWPLQPIPTSSPFGPPQFVSTLK